MSSLITRIVKRISSFYPNLKYSLRTAHTLMSPEKFVYAQLKFAFPFSLVLTFLFFFIATKARLPLYYTPIFFVVAFFVLFNFGFLQLRGKIVARQREIDREVLFAGQYLLIKLYGGQPLLNALIASTKSYGVASRYIKEIVDDIDTGSPLEKALENAIRYSPSDKFRKILFNLNNALRLGIDVTTPLRNVLDEIRAEQEIEIKRYGKTLNSLVIFYMLAAVVVPSIGMTIFIVIASFVNLDLTIFHFVAVCFFIIVIELIFIGLFKSIRPTVNI